MLERAASGSADHLGTFSPTLGQGIGLALIDTIAEVAENDEIAVDVRRPPAAAGVKPPFVPAHVR